jgi:3',5'-cyclic AMP phosphodiesterase CpdA
MSAAGVPIRLAHFSDLHIAAPGAWRLRDWLSKRLTSWINLRLLGRSRKFAQAERVVAALAAELRQRGFDRLLFSGDATALGFEEEQARAAQLLGVGRPGMPPGLAVPGNHDYLNALAARGHFERHFAPWLAGERVEEAVYPFAQRVGPAWVVAVNSSKPNWWPTDASGRVGEAQLRRLEMLLARLEGGPRILVTHYPPTRHGPHGRELLDAEALVEVARRGSIGLWLHGHHHQPCHQAPEGVPFPVICAGSATQRGRWSYGEYILIGRRLAAVQRVFEDKSGCFVEGPRFELELGNGS